jgi:hypothetical protein
MLPELKAVRDLDSEYTYQQAEIDNDRERYRAYRIKRDQLLIALAQATVPTQLHWSFDMQKLAELDSITEGVQFLCITHGLSILTYHNHDFWGGDGHRHNIHCYYGWAQLTQEEVADGQT